MEHTAMDAGVEEETTMRLAGRLITGTGKGGEFVALPWVREWLQEAMDLPAYPGTLNVELDAPSSRRWRSLRERDPGIRLAPPTPDMCEARWYAVRLDDSVPGAIVVPDVDGYPADQVEIVAADHLRSRLRLADGSTVRLTVAS